MTARSVRPKAKERNGLDVEAKSVVRLKVPERDDSCGAFETLLVRARPSIDEPDSGPRSADALGRGRANDASFVACLEELRAPLLASLPRGGRAWDGADVVQEVLLALWCRATQLAGKSRAELAPYARAAAAHARSNECRGESRSNRRDDSWALDEQRHAPGAEELLLRREDVELCRRLLGALPRTLLEVVLAHENEGLTTDESGAELAIPATLVKSRLRRARKTLRRLYARAHLSNADPPSSKRSKHGDIK